MTAVTPEFLLKGGWFALEQAGRLVTDATALFEAGSYSTSVGLALLSTEELAKSLTLFHLWMDATRGKSVTRPQIKLTDHKKKQGYGASHTSFPLDRESLEILRGGPDAAPARYAEVRDELNRRFHKWLEEGPSVRHQQRLRAFYVDAAKDEETWLRPSDVTREEAQAIITDARNAYWQQHSAPGIPAWAPDMEALNVALAAWQDKPPLPPVEFS